MVAQDPLRWLLELPNGQLINGQEEVGQAEGLVVENPATGGVLCELPMASAAQVDAAVAGARSAFETWSRESPDRRSAFIHQFADTLEKWAEVLIPMIVDDVGSPVSTARGGQVALPIAHLRWYADAAKSVTSTPLPPHIGTQPSGGLVHYRPKGVVAAITAYNYPLMLALTKVGAALAAGCTTVLLPSPLAPLATVMLGRIARESELPDGVINVVVGDASVGRALVSHPDVAHITFTGSVPTGEVIARQAAQGSKGLTLELGGKACALLMPGNDPDEMIRAATLRLMRHAGQGCSAPTRILVPNEQIARVLDLARELYPTIPVGNPWDESTIAGPLISERQRATVEGFVERASEAGYDIAAGGTRPELPRGWYYNPTLIGPVPPTAEIAQEEVFGPVAALIGYRDLDEAVEIADGTIYGLHAYVYGRDFGAALEVAQRMRVGTVQINGGGPRRPDVPMGGMKSSGVGREMGRWGIEEFLEPQHIQWPLGASW